MSQNIYLFEKLIDIKLVTSINYPLLYLNTTLLLKVKLKKCNFRYLYLLLFGRQC